MTIVLRPATAHDADAIAALFTASRKLLDFLPPLHSAEEDRAFIADIVLPGQRVTLAVSGDRVAGFLAEEPGWINHLYVAPEALGRGIGSMLLADAKTRHETLELWCFADNRRARRFYEAHGFAEVERTDGSGNEERMPDIRFRWRRS